MSLQVSSKSAVAESDTPILDSALTVVNTLGQQPPRRFVFSRNSRIRNKPSTDEGKRRVGWGWEPIETDLTGVARVIKSGNAVNASLLTGKRRSDGAFAALGWVVVDVDNEISVDGSKIYLNELTIDGALGLPLVKASGAFGYTTPSHGRPEPNAPNGVHEKFRLIFPTPTLITDPAHAKQVIRLVYEQIPGADPATVSISNVFYGNTNADVFLFNPNAAPLPQALIDEAAARAAEAAKVVTPPIDADPVTASKLLSLIPNDDATVPDWETYRNLIFAAYNAGVPEEVARAWAASSAKFTEDGFLDVWAPKTTDKAPLGIGFLTRFVRGFRPVPSTFEFSSDVETPAVTPYKWSELRTDPEVAAAVLAAPTAPVILDSADDLPELLKTALTASTAAGAPPTVLVNLGTGEGKTTLLTTMATEGALSDYQVVFASLDKYNPPDPRLLTVDAVPSHHHGLVRETLPDGRIRIRLAKSPDEANTKATCDFPEAFNRVGNLGIEVPTVPSKSGSSEVSAICAGCPRERRCPFVLGRRSALQADVFRIHPAQFPEATDAAFDYSGALVIADELDQWAFTDTRSLTRDDLAHALQDLADAKLDLPDAWAEFFSRLRVEWLGGGELGAYGLTHSQIVATLPAELPGFDTTAARSVLGDTNDAAFAALFDGVLDDDPLVEGYAIDRARLNLNLGKLRPPNVVLDILDILQGTTPGAVRITPAGGIELTRRNAVADRLRRFGARVILSATATPADVAAKTGIPEDQILVVTKAPPVGATVNHIVVADMGRMSRNRSVDQNRRLATLLDYAKKTHGGPLAVASYKAIYQQHADSELFAAADVTLTHGTSDVVGSNVAKDARVLFSDGVDVPNLGAIESEYITLTGRVPAPGVAPAFYRQPTVAGSIPDGTALAYVALESADEGLRLYVRRRVVTAQIQTHGRLRANLRPGHTLYHYHSAAYPIPFEASVVRADELTPEAAPKSEITLRRVVEAVRDLAEAGVTLTQSAVAELAGISQATVSRAVATLRRLALRGALPPLLRDLVAGLGAAALKYLNATAAALITSKAPKPVGSSSVTSTTETKTNSLLNLAMKTKSSPGQLDIFAAEPAPPVSAATDNYRILRPTDADYLTQLAALALHDGPVALDIETYDPTPGAKKAALDPLTGAVRLIQLGVNGLAYIVDLGGRNDDRAAIRAAHEPFFERLAGLFATATIVGHNLSFDLRFLGYQYGLRAERVSDTRIGAQVLYGDYGAACRGNGSALAGGYGLENCAFAFLGVHLDKTSQTADWGDVLTQAMLDYAAADALTTLALRSALFDAYSTPGGPLYAPTLLNGWALENSMVPLFLEIERAGVPVDRGALDDLSAKISTASATLEARWAALKPGVNPRSPSQLTKALGLPNTQAATLQAHAADPAVAVLHQIRALAKLSDNVAYFAASADAFGDDRLRTMFKTLDGTGRSSSGGAKVSAAFGNLQNISAKIPESLAEFGFPPVRSVVRPPTGKTMAVVDLAAAHARIAASEANDQNAIAAFLDPSVDTHCQVAAYVAQAQGLPWSWEYIASARKDKNSPDQPRAKALRDIAKTTYYSWLNGAGPRRVQSAILAETGVEPSLDDCSKALAGCRELFPGIAAYIESSVAALNAKPFVVDGRPFALNQTSDGFRVVIEMEPDQNGRFEAPFNVAVASTWSRIEATAMKRGLAAVFELAKANPEWGLEVTNFVHDEIDVLVNDAYAPAAISAVNDAVGDAFAAVLRNGCPDGRAADWSTLVVSSWADK